MAEVGRPKKDIDWDQFDTLCGIQCTRDEIAAVLKMSHDTLERRVKEEFGVDFASKFDEKRKAGHASLRRKQWAKAMEGHPIMLIFLGKQYLGQTDKVEQTIDATIKDITYESEWGSVINKDE